MEIKKEKFNGNWPFSLAKVQIEKVNFELYVIANNERYALNGYAAQTKKGKDIDAIWMDDPQIIGVKVSLSDVINFGLKL